MENASKIMYRIANIFNWIALVLGVLCLVLGIVCMVNPNITNGQNTVEEVTAAGITLIVAAVWILIWNILLIVLTRKAAEKGSSQNWDILFLIFGILGGSIFYILGGIFGIIGHEDSHAAK
ncbi:MAG: hypothetical protein LKM30_07310 [Bacilli bacterium]|jgi:uncharacterized membrane protein HdeD (DUF308 family)|nr:hypothetical protein [Bacilli bacterium]